MVEPTIEIKVSLFDKNNKLVHQAKIVDSDDLVVGWMLTDRIINFVEKHINLFRRIVKELTIKKEKKNEG